MFDPPMEDPVHAMITEQFAEIDQLTTERDALRAQLAACHELMRAWRATVDIDRNSKGEDPVIMHNGRNNSAREINAAGVALAEYVDSLEVAK